MLATGNECLDKGIYLDYKLQIYFADINVIDK